MTKATRRARTPSAAAAKELRSLLSSLAAIRVLKYIADQPLDTARLRERLRARGTALDTAIPESHISADAPARLATIQEPRALHYTARSRGAGGRHVRAQKPFGAHPSPNMTRTPPAPDDNVVICYNPLADVISVQIPADALLKGLL